MQTVGIIIPARYESSRFPGKPLSMIAGKTLIQRTWEQCTEVGNVDAVFVATDDPRIVNHLSDIGAESILTDRACLTGTDRVAEANEHLNFDLVVNVQGDEPIINPDTIAKFVDFAKNNNESVTVAHTRITDSTEHTSINVPKFVVSNNQKLIYASRSAVPRAKDDAPTVCFKQVGIYGLPRCYLREFYASKQKKPIEQIEDIEVLRFIEMGVPVLSKEVEGGNIAVDTSLDIHKVVDFLEGRVI